MDATSSILHGSEIIIIIIDEKNEFGSKNNSDIIFLILI